MGVGKERAGILTLVFMGMHRLMQCLCHAYKKDAKNDEAIDCCTQQFSRGFWRLHASKYAI